MRKKIKQRDPVQCTINSLSHEGRGITQINGKTVFLDNGLAGEEVIFNYTKKHKQYDEGLVKEILEASPERVTPKCPHFNVCGGCSLQHMQHSKQLEIKQAALLEQFEHFAHTNPDEILPPLTANIWGYRHKARLGAKYVTKKEKLLVGFREKDGRFLADLITCPVLYPSVGEHLPDFSALIASLSCYREVPQIEVAISDDITALIFRHLAPFTNDDLEKLTAFGKQHNFYIYLQPNKIDSIHLLYPQETSPYLTYELPEYDLQFKFHPTDFTQVNSEINQLMIKQAINLLNPQANETILDLFCGIGNFTLPIAKSCAKIIGVEGSNTAISRAQENAKLNNITNCEFHCTDLFEPINNFPWAEQQYDKILLDPPRSGAAEICNQIEKFNAKKIVYVSCNPATLARDADTLIAKGYKLKAAGIMDMFPHTKHVESMAVFEK